MGAGFQMGIITNNNPNIGASVANLSRVATIYNQNKYKENVEKMMKQLIDGCLHHSDSVILTNQ